MNTMTPSLDRSSLYILTDEPGGPSILRMRASDFKVETIAKLATMRLAYDNTLGPVASGVWIGITADGSLALTRDIGSSEIYALDVKWP